MMTAAAPYMALSQCSEQPFHLLLLSLWPSPVAVTPNTPSLAACQLCTALQALSSPSSLSGCLASRHAVFGSRRLPGRQAWATWLRCHLLLARRCSHIWHQGSASGALAWHQWLQPHHQQRMLKKSLTPAAVCSPSSKGCAPCRRCCCTPAACQAAGAPGWLAPGLVGCAAASACCCARCSRAAEGCASSGP